MCYLSDIMFQWRTIPNYSEYEVSNYGHFRHKKRKRILKGSYDTKGYVRFEIKNDDGEKKTIRRGRTFGLCFIHNDDHENKTQIDHIDRNRANDSMSNLRWVTPKQNVNNRGECKSPTRKNKSGIKYISPQDGKWKLKYKGKYIGIYKKKSDAKNKLKEIKYLSII